MRLERKGLQVGRPSLSGRYSILLCARILACVPGVACYLYQRDLSSFRHLSTVLLSRRTCSLDNVCAEPNPSDARYLAGLHKTYVQHQDFPRTKPKDVVSVHTCSNVVPRERGSSRASLWVISRTYVCVGGIFILWTIARDVA